MDVIRNHGEKYNITEIHPHHLNDLKDYSDKLMNISLKLQEAQETEGFLQYWEIKNEGIILLKELMNSKLFNEYCSHHAKISIIELWIWSLNGMIPDLLSSLALLFLFQLISTFSCAAVDNQYLILRLSF